MSEPVLSVEHLGKQYRIGSLGPRYATFREALIRAASAPWRRFRQLSGSVSPSDAIWAVRDVCFEVMPGEVVGIIGRNGAGKSTLLKILSQITEPTEGRVVLNGRVASLLEVGTGFHPELTGRENVFLNGAILGMGRREIAAKFDEIVAFAEVEKFIDTPVKFYSSGMYMRLAFAVAAHLEPDILVVDEVLAVGDATFQEKCLGKMGEVSRSGRTVLFVSHSMGAIKSLCQRAILLNQGRIEYDGEVHAAVERYLFSAKESADTVVIPADAPRIGTGEARLRSVRLTDCSGRPTNELYYGQPFEAILLCEVLEEVPAAHFEISVSTLDGTQVTYTSTHPCGGGNGPCRLVKGLYEVRASIDVMLLPRRYTLTVGIHRDGGHSMDFVERTLDFSVLKVAEDGVSSYPWRDVRGLVCVGANWTLGAPGETEPALSEVGPRTERE